MPVMKQCLAFLKHFLMCTLASHRVGYFLVLEFLKRSDEFIDMLCNFCGGGVIQGATSRVG